MNLDHVHRGKVPVEKLAYPCQDLQGRRKAINHSCRYKVSVKRVEPKRLCPGKPLDFGLVASQ